MKLSLAFAAALGFGFTAHAQGNVASTCPTSNVCYGLNIPNTTAQSGNGDIYFSISAPTSYEWVALGQGTQMTGSNIFIIYTSSSGQNVTLSPRIAYGQIEPQVDNSAQLTLLDGSGVSGGVMTANVRCSNCQSWSGGSGTMDFTASSASWIYAYKAGSPVNSDELTVNLPKHDEAGSFNWSFAQAKGGDSANPFVSNAGTDPTTPTSPSTPTSSNSANYNNPAAPFGGNAAMGRHLIVIHGALAAIAFIALFPSGGILIRLGNMTNLIWIHAALQIAALGFYIVAFGLGVYIATQLSLFNNHHPIIGCIILVALLIQPLSGLLHHKFFKKYGRRTGWSFEHINIGRAAILIGIINGGNGLHLADAKVGALVAYGVCAVIMVVAYIASIVIGERRRKRQLASGLAPNLDGQRMQSRGLNSEDGAVRLNESFGQKG